MKTKGTKQTRPGLFRTLAAIFYDSLLLFAVLFFATFALLPFTQGEAIRPNQPAYSAYLLAVSFFYFGWFWTHGGQTLGMRAWRIRVETREGNTITWTRALLRFVGAMLSWLAAGIGFLWILVDKERLSWHDRLSKTRLVPTA